MDILTKLRKFAARIKGFFEVKNDEKLARILNDHLKSMNKEKSKWL